MNKHIGDYISTLRKKKGLTQVKLAEILGVSDKTISKWERNEGLPDVGILKDLAVSLDTSVDSLLNGAPVKVSSLMKGLGSSSDIDRIKYYFTSLVSFYFAYRAIVLTFAYGVVRDGYTNDINIIVNDVYSLISYSVLLIVISFSLFNYFSKIIYGSNFRPVGVIPTLLKIMWFGPILLLSSQHLNFSGFTFFDIRIANDLWILYAVFQFYRLIKSIKSIS